MSTYTVGRDVQALVADVGSYSTKIGYAGDDHPQAVYSSTSAVVRSAQGAGGGSRFSRLPRRDFATRCLEGEGGDGRYELTNPVDPVTGWLFNAPGKYHGGSSLSSNEIDPVDGEASADGDVNDGLGDAWESHELISRYLQQAFRHSLGLGGPSSLDSSVGHPLLLLDKPHSPPALRQRLLEILFETHGLPAAFFLRDAIASCYAVGRTTATVVDVGYSATMVTPVYEGFVEARGVLRNIGCGAKVTEERVLTMMDDVVRKQGGRRRKDRMKRINMRRLERESSSIGLGAASSGSEQQNNSGNSPQKRASIKRDRDASGHFIKESASQSLAPIPDYLMPVYQVRRAPSYTVRSTHFHHWSRLALAREIKEMGLGVAVGPMGYISSAATAAATDAGESPVDDPAAAENALNPATANNMFLTSSKLPYTLPDGTPVEISTASRCDVAEMFFGNDEFNNNYRERALDEATAKLEEYESEIEEFIAEKEGEEESSEMQGRVGIVSSSDAAGHPYSNTSYRGERSSRNYAGRIRRGAGGEERFYSPNTISAKLYAACLPYVRTAPPSAGVGDGADGGSGGGGASGGGDCSGVNSDSYFHYLTSAPPAQMVCDASFRCDRDQQASLLGNVVLCGGGACVTGAAGAPPGGGAGGAGHQMASALGDEHAFPDRLREEIEAVVHRHTPGWRVKMTSPNVSERAICSWLGGSILGSLGTFQDMWISRRDYDEFGAAIVNRKCP